MPRLILLVFLSLATTASAAEPEWIWFDNPGRAAGTNEIRFFRHVFEIQKPVRTAVLRAAGDDEITVYLNGREVARSRNWNQAATTVVSEALERGTNVLAARARNRMGDAGIIIRLEIAFEDGTRQEVSTDRQWLAADKETGGWEARSFQSGNWSPAKSIARLGAQPRGDVFAAKTATPAANLQVLPGFSVSLLRNAPPEEGSWICLTFDNKGRLIISPQGEKQPLLRVTLGSGGQVSKVERIRRPVWSAMGLLYAFDSLYVNGKGEQGLGLYRLRDKDGDDDYDSHELLLKFAGDGGEHGPHAVVAGPDQRLYVMNGNFVKIPSTIAGTSPFRNYAEDLLLPREDDGNGFGVGILPPGGHVLRGDPDGKQWELFAGGLRNSYGMAFNPDGELFTFDSDMEWDWGTPWYRATRIYHLVSGGDYGFREGTGKWPAYYPDCLPPTLDIGIGSPTGVAFGTRSKFPEKYQRAFYAMDWSYGRIVAVHLQPAGASYRAAFEPFVTGKPLNVTDLEIGPDGAMYFITGGRGTQSGLYRVSHSGSGAASPSTASSSDGSSAAARALRKKLESYHGRAQEGAVDIIWPHLGNSDRFVRYAARVALESQDIRFWQEKVLDENNVQAGLQALAAVARKGSKDLLQPLLDKLGKLADQGLNEQQTLEALRVVQLAFIRLGKPEEGLAEDVAGALQGLFPAASFDLNRELSQLLIYLRAPGVVEKCLELLSRAATQEEQLHYIFHLRNFQQGATRAEKERYFQWFHRDRSKDRHPPEVLKWFADVERPYTDGASFPKFIAKVRERALAALSPAERTELASVTAPPAVPPPKTETNSPPRTLVREWRMEDLVPHLQKVSANRNLARGREVFIAGQCLACHKFGDAGGSVGPDVTGAASRFSVPDLLETMILPSKIISDQYQNITVTTKEGDEITGRLIEETPGKVVLITEPLTQQRAEIEKSRIKSRAVSKVSSMPDGLLNTFNLEEILDLLAYILNPGGGAPRPAGKS